MKNLILVALFAFAVSACSSGSSDSRGPANGPKTPGGGQQGGTIGNGDDSADDGLNSPITAPDTNDQAANFDAAAKGNWVSVNCFPNGQTSFRFVLSVYGGGQARRMQYTYGDRNCGGQPQGGLGQNLTYRVDRYANGGGQITVGDQMYDVMFNGNNMDMMSADESITYQRIN